MKARSLLGLTGALLAPGGPALAQALPPGAPLNGQPGGLMLTLDETKSGSMQPFPGGQQVAEGAIAVLDPGGKQSDFSTWSDLLTFGPGLSGAPEVSLFSDNADGEEDFADLAGLEKLTVAGSVTEDDKGMATYTATNPTTGKVNTYVVRSDADVPEPGPLALLGLGLLAALPAARRRRASAV